MVSHSMQYGLEILLGWDGWLGAYQARGEMCPGLQPICLGRSELSHSFPKLMSTTMIWSFSILITLEELMFGLVPTAERVQPHHGARGRDETSRSQVGGRRAISHDMCPVGATTFFPLSPTSCVLAAW